MEFVDICCTSATPTTVRIDNTLDNAATASEPKIFFPQQKLNTIRGWTDRVRSMDAHHVTENRLIFVNCQALQEHLVQRLSTSFRQLISFVIKEAVTIGKDFVREMREILKVSEDF